MKDFIPVKAWLEFIELIKNYWWYAGKWHVAECPFILLDQGVCNCEEINPS